MSYPLDVSHLLVVLEALTAERPEADVEHARLRDLSGEDLAVEFARKVLGLWCDHKSAQEWTECAACSFPRGPFGDPISPKDLSLKNLVPHQWVCAPHHAAAGSS